MEPFENEHISRIGGLEDARGVQPAPDAPFIEYWMWHEGELIPATPEELEWIHERERERDARWRLKQWRQQAQPRDARRQSLRGVYAAVARRLAIWRRGAVRSASRTVRTEATREKWATPTER